LRAEALGKQVKHPRLDPNEVEEELDDQDDKGSDASEVDSDPESESVESDDEREVMEPADVPAADGRRGVGARVAGRRLGRGRRVK
jgi:hypothetical protein